MKVLVKSILAAVLLLGTTGAWAQKIDQRLTGLVEQVAKSRAMGTKPIEVEALRKQIVVNMNEDGTIGSLSAIATLKQGAECPTAKLAQMGIKVRFVLGDMVALVIPADKLAALEEVEAFSFVKADEITHLMNEEIRKETGVERVNTAAAAAAESLPKAYTGAGVVVGIIDVGIDYNHAAFRNADGTTRIKRIWDSKTRKDYTTDEEIRKLTSDIEHESHGTHISATAGGSYTDSKQQGMAPEADLYLCGVGAAKANSDILECMTKIFKYAEEVGKPAVINMSIGDLMGLHDGSHEYSKATATLTNNGTAPGRAVIISSGNSGEKYQSIVKAVHPGQLVAGKWQLATVLGATSIPTQENPLASPTYLSDCFIYASDFQDFEVKLAVVNITTGEIKEFGNLVKNAKNQPVTAEQLLVKDTQCQTLKGGFATVYKLYLKATPVYIDDNACRLALLINGKSDGQVIKMVSDGDGNDEPCFNAPTEYGYNFATAGYTKGNGDLACNTAICSDYVISVGSYITRPGWINFQGREMLYPASTLTGKVQQLGEISDFSSYCVDDNGKPHPTIIAPGQGVASAINNYDTCYFFKGIAGVPDPTLDQYGTITHNIEKHNRDNWYAVSQGTSMSSPAAAGIIALWMQANPKLSVNDILAILKETSRNDAYTTDVTKIPSGNKVQAGMGKIDCLAGLKKILNSSGIETVAAGERRGATPATMYSVDAPVYNMMGQRVDKSQRGIVVYKGRKYMNK